MGSDEADNDSANAAAGCVVDGRRVVEVVAQSHRLRKVVVEVVHAHKVAADQHVPETERRRRESVRHPRVATIVVI